MNGGDDSGPLEVDVEVDAAGLKCPLPVLRLGRALRPLPQGALVRLAATDPAAWVDVPHFCAEAGHELVSAESEGGRHLFIVRRG